MLKEAKKWVQELETMLTDLSEEFGKSVDELDAAFENWYYDGGQQWDFPSSGPNAVEAFRRDYSFRMEEEEEEEETVDVAIVEGLLFNYYDCDNMPYDKDVIAKLHNTIGNRKINWVRGQNVYTGGLVSEETFQKYVDLYNAYDAATK